MNDDSKHGRIIAQLSEKLADLVHGQVLERYSEALEAAPPESYWRHRATRAEEKMDAAYAEMTDGTTT
jgi:hypothetical protein